MQKYFYETVGQLHGTLAQVFKDSLIVGAPMKILFLRKYIGREHLAKPFFLMSN